jgi:hypothetical protein
MLSIQILGRPQEGSPRRTNHKLNQDRHARENNVSDPIWPVKIHQSNKRQPHPKSPTYGSILPQDILASQCITSQTSLGWDQFLRGRISLSWRRFFCYYRYGHDLNGDIWSKKILLAIWSYTESIGITGIT